MEQNRNDEIIIEILLKSGKKHFIIYDLKKEKELTWHSSSPDAQILFDNAGNPYLSERKLGIYKLEDKIIRHEFHLEGDNYEKLAI